MITIRDVHKRFGEHDVLTGVDLDIPHAATVTVIGPSGSGKSTLLRVIDVLEHADGGTIDFGDGPVDLATRDKATIRAIRSRIGFVFQNYNLFANKTALQNVTEPLIYAQGKPRKEAEAIGREQLDRVGLADFADRYPSTLSGGQQQRVGIARAIAAKPELLLLDEPTSALDPELTGEVLKVIRSLAEQKTTMIIVTHEMAFARDVADQVIFMDGGVIVEQGPARQVIEQPQEERTRQFLARYSEN